MAAAPSVLLKKTMSFKGGSRFFTNRYHFLGGTPADATHWHTLMDAVVTAEKAIYNGSVTIVEAIGYAAGSDVPVASKVYSTAGTLTPLAGSSDTPGEVAALVRYSTAERTTKNHPIYLFNYYHRVHVLASTGFPDTLDGTTKAAMASYAGSWISGFSDGTITATRCGPNGQAATGSVVEEYVTHRDFPYQTSV
uniref:Uncharacterized protein n=1 Tax=uncultured prokaryote TaxID=198431 RepID=A0A0H5Q4L5_9ZZZZ|nr:hypothetical protein [uncultured prokaryote]